MFALQRLADDLVQVVLPPPPSLPKPWANPRNVYVLLGPSPALIDTGAREHAPALRAALQELAIAPEAIRRVGLTSRSTFAWGNLELFPNAVAWTAAPARDLAAERARWSEVYAALQVMDGAPLAWADVDVASFLDRLFEDEPSLVAVEDGTALRLGTRVFDALRCDGTQEAAGAFYAADQSWLFAGPALNVLPRALPSDPGAWLETIGRLGQLSTRTVFPASGFVETSPSILFRTLSLYATNLRTNLQHVLDTWRSAVDLAEVDVGYLPDDLLRFGATVMSFDAAFGEFQRAGVVRTEDDSSVRFPRFKMGAGSGRVAPKPI